MCSLAGASRTHHFSNSLRRASSCGEKGCQAHNQTQDEKVDNAPFPFTVSLVSSRVSSGDHATTAKSADLILWRQLPSGKEGRARNRCRLPQGLRVCRPWRNAAKVESGGLDWLHIDFCRAS